MSRFWEDLNYFDNINYWSQHPAPTSVARIKYISLLNFDRYWKMFHQCLTSSKTWVDRRVKNKKVFYTFLSGIYFILHQMLTPKSCQSCVRNDTIELAVGGVGEWFTGYKDTNCMQIVDLLMQFSSQHQVYHKQSCRGLQFWKGILISKDQRICRKSFYWFIFFNFGL